MTLVSSVSRQRRDLDLDDWHDDWHDDWEEYGSATAVWVCVGLVVLALVLLGGCVALCCCCCRRRKQRGKVVRVKPAVQSPTITVTHPSTTQISTMDATSATQQIAYPSQPPSQSQYPSQPPSSGYPASPPAVYPSLPGAYPYPPPEQPFAPGPYGMPPPYDGHSRQPAYNPGFQPGPADVKTPM